MAEIATTLIATFGGVAIACITYSLTKMREREAELRKEKLEHYKDLVASLSGIIKGEDTPDAQRAFSRACNKLNLIAPHQVVKAMQDFQQAIKTSNTNLSHEKHDQLMSRLFHEMRKDLRVTPKDKDSTFVFSLWSAGCPPQNNSNWQ
jgi:biopolymer transport protein ExbB/TolQ